MEHEKVYAVCENKCFVETMTKEQIDNDVETLNQGVTNLNDTINTMSAIEIRHPAGSVMSVIPPNSYNKTRHLFINDSGSSKPLRASAVQGTRDTYVKVSWIKMTNGNTTLNTRIVYIENDSTFVELATIATGETYYIEIENLSYTEPAEE